MTEKRNYNISSSDYRISDIYQGGYSSLIPPSENYIKSGSLGLTTDPKTANVLQEVSSKLSSGVKNIEVEGVSSEIFDSIPNNQLREVHRLSKLTGVNISMHAPVMNVSGIDPRSGFSESERAAAERRVQQILLRARELSPDGNVPVNFHSAEGIPGSQFLPPSKVKQLEEKNKTKYEQLVIVNRETGSINTAKKDILNIPGDEKIITEELTPEKVLENLNKNDWDNKVTELFFNKEKLDNLLERNRPFIEGLIEDIKKGKFKEEDFEFSPKQREIFKSYKDAEVYLEDLYKKVNSLFSKAYEFGTEEQKKKLERINENFSKILSKNRISPFVQSEAIHYLLHEFKDPSNNLNPNIYVPIEEFAIEQSSKTFGNAAYNTYKELKGKNVPLMVIENPPAGFALSTGEDIRKLVEAARNQFIKKAVEDGMSESKAEEEAKKLIGVTWDVGHINMLRRFGYSEEEIVKETEKIAPYIKHVHLSDNFGFEHTELPMGMGNVPLKDIMKRLGEKGFEATKIIEAGNWWQHFRTPPFQETLEAVGSPI
ncbi:MAG: TIM barrel protein, partial [Candidatus Pacearchaeota archaeon]